MSLYIEHLKGKLEEGGWGWRGGVEALQSRGTNQTSAHCGVLDVVVVEDQATNTQIRLKNKASQSRIRFKLALKNHSQAANYNTLQLIYSGTVHYS